ncbi:hypothetical protein FGADI_9991 [Fusarium gaditjirri]|uniref:Uncharacterized protein n=1 Tax=Fusarium gaditjirri TaxID=282569 RepID=A0A8H4SYE5_9HYPO|nr:hypothetical protein FGADI_9991 [Fusarium gaditjirri]
MPFPRILRLQDDKWNNPEDSIGTFIGYLRGGRYRCWEAAGPARLAFRELSPEIKDFLETSSIPPTDIVSWSIYMVGHNEKNAAPKLLICSTDSKTRKNIRQLIKDSKIMDKYPGIGLGDVSALPDRHVIRELSREAIEALLPHGCDIDGAVLAEGSEPALGKRIFVVNPHDFSLRPATTGPIILQGGRCYQLTVAHAFRHSRELDHLSDQQMAEDDCDFDGMSDTERDEESQYDEMTSKGSATPGEIDSDEASFVASLDAFSGEKHSSSRSESSSSDQLDSGNDPQLSVESQGNNPGFYEFDVSQLQFFGRLVLSSLTGSNPSLDYALIETSNMAESLEKSSLITGSLVSSIGEIESDDISIVATTSPNCPVEGRLTSTPSYIRLPGQRTFQQVYPIRLGKPLHDGDCGTAVFGKDDKRLYGHIVAGGPGTSIAYLVPAGEISRDIQARLGFGLTCIPQQDGQGQHSKDDLQLSTRLVPGSTNSGVSSITNISTSELEETHGDRLPQSIGVQQLKSQPSQSSFISSPSFFEYKSCNYTNSAMDQPVFPGISNRFGFEIPSFDLPSPTDGLITIDQDIELPVLSLPARDWPTISDTSSGPQTRGQHKGPTDSSGQQLLWSQTGTDASSTSNELPKRQNKHSADNSKDPLPKRYKAKHESHTAAGLSRRPVLPQDFEGACETCFFWLLSPEQFSSPEWHACSGRKDEIGHIVTHAVNHHGLTRGRDPQHSARKYLTSCQSFSPFVKAKGNCAKCSSLSEWTDTDFADPKHRGVVICLRCWRKFDKKQMKEHLAKPLCDYNAEQPKAEKLWILYTAFCSETQLPSKPPKNMPPPRSKRQSSQRAIRKSREQRQWDLIGSNPGLQTIIDATDPPPLQSTDRHQELKPKGQMSPSQLDDIEKDSGCGSTDDEST